MVPDYLALLAIVGVLTYYTVAWIKAGRDPARGIQVTLYEPPRNLSPAMLRYVWKQSFDDRAFWAGVLSLASKGLATIESSDKGTVLRAVEASPTGVIVPKEEQAVLEQLRGRYRGKTIRMQLSMLDAETANAAWNMGKELRRAALGKWFRQNRSYVIAGMILSLIAIFASANPRSFDQWGALILGLAVMGPAVFYLAFLCLRIRDLVRAGRAGVPGFVLRRAILLLVLLVPCLMGILLGIVVIDFNFGWLVLGVTAVLLVVNLLFAYLMKAPTAEGRKLLDEIEGFRHFLRSVEKLPMDRADSPESNSTVYERYLPYAVALEVEQTWCDRFVALASTIHEQEFANTHTFYLGMWDGKPIEIVLAPLEQKFVYRRGP